MLSITATPFYYVRHGQTDWNRERRCMGQTDIPLNAHGKHQAMLARNRLMGLGITTICHSPLLRAKMTAEIIQETLNCKLVEIEELREFNLGSYEGKIKDKWFQDWRSGAVIPQAETYAHFIERCLKGINTALALPGLVLIIAHGGVYCAIEHATCVFIEGGLQNCIPFFHEPPKIEDEKWTIHSVMECV